MRTGYRILAMSLIVTAAVFQAGCGGKTGEEIERITPRTGTMTVSVSTTGSVEPRNRLELKPSVGGRVEEIYVTEGQNVRSGQVLAIMSSTERAALIDAARSQGGAAEEYWKNAYKPIPVIAPISGTVIVRSVEPGQTVTTTSAILVLSDRLIVSADVDETDIGRVQVGQRARISLDAHPDVSVGGRVSHISYESTVVNNVTMYKVEIIPDDIPGVFRSGMTADIEIVEKVRKDVMIVPLDAVRYADGKAFVMVERGKNVPPERVEVRTGITGDSEIEITGAITTNDTIQVHRRKISLDSPETGRNPFMPQRPKGR